MSEPFLVSIPVPKTAGTTLADIYSCACACRVIFDYDGYATKIINSLLLNNLSFVREYFYVLRRHFLAKKYLPDLHNDMFIATVRETVNRMISQYIHKLNEPSADALYHNYIITCRMNVLEFATTVENAQARHLDGRAIDEYDLPLVSKKLKQSLIVFSHIIRPLHLEQHFGHWIALHTENANSYATKQYRVTII